MGAGHERQRLGMDALALGEDPQKSSYNYPYYATDGRENLDAPDSVLRVMRGGAFSLVARFVRCASRLRYYPYNRHGRRGFRVVTPALGEG